MKTYHYIAGFDLGISSIGWAAVEIDQAENPIGLIDCGVRTFEKAEVPNKTGESLAASRRLARSARRLVRRRARRILRLRRAFKRIGLLTHNDFNVQGIPCNLPINVWQLRLKGLDQCLNNHEWAAVLQHLIKHRGYQSMRKSERKTDSKELGRLLSGVQHNQQLLAEKKYRTPAELALHEFAEHLRNKSGDYSHTFSREALRDELSLLFKQQRLLGNPFTTDEFERFVIDLLLQQKPALAGDAILKRLGRCSLEPAEYKAAKQSYSAERFVWLTKLNNLRLEAEDQERSLTLQERNVLMDQPYMKTKLTYKQVRSLLELDDGVLFKGLRYGNDKDPETQVLIELKGYHGIRKTLENAGLKIEWQTLATQPHLLDAIVTALACYKTDQDIRQQLAPLGLSGRIVDALLELEFSQFIQVSLKALGHILPLMQQGQRFDQARDVCYQIAKATQQQLLPAIPADEIRNPVVLRALSQARKVLNHLIREYGAPARVHIETAREVGKSSRDRKDIEKSQQENRKRRETEINVLRELFPSHHAKGQDLLKLQLYNEQNGQCLYSGKAIDIERLFEIGYLEIDHALPQSRSWDNSYFNKVLVLTSANRNKGNQTPYEWLKGKEDTAIWRAFVARVNSLKIALNKKKRILSQQISDDFISRNLNDTRWISRFFMNFVEQNLSFSGKSKRPVFASNGQLTAMLRGRWGLTKAREENDRHHAIDAIVVACTTRSIQQRVTNFIRYNELKNIVSNHYVDPTTGELVDLKTIQHETLHFPQPWPHFRDEVLRRVFSNHPIEDLQLLKDRPQALLYPIKPLFVSRSPMHKISGQAHEETIRSAKRLDEGISITKVPLSKLKLADLEKIVNREREPQLIEALRQQLLRFNGDGRKAFSQPFYKPDRMGNPGQQIKGVRVQRVQNSGVLVRENKMGIADNGSMIRVDIFSKSGKFFAIPIYAWQVTLPELPNRAVVANKSENQWVEIDASFEFLFSLQTNDLLKVQLKKQTWFGYYIGFHRGTGAINLLAHDRDINIGEQGLISGIGIKTAISLEKYRVDILGHIFAVGKKEQRKPLK